MLEAGGTAADAAVAACLASCVAETVMTGLLGGGHAIYVDVLDGIAHSLDCFCAVPSKTGGGLLELDVPFGEELVHYAVGPASCAVPGLPAGLDALWREHGRLPWPDLCAPALRLAREGVPMPPAHVACLEMLAPVMTMDEGARIYAPGGRLLRPGEPLQQPGLATALEAIAAEGATSVYGGSIAEALLALIEERDGLITRQDLEEYAAAWSEPAPVPFAGTRLLTRAGLAPVGPALARMPRLRGLGEPERTLAFLDALQDASGPETHTTNLAVVDAEGGVCVLTTSLGLGSGDWLPGLDLHLNSMLGEADLLVGPLRPGERMQSMMAPSVAVDGEGPALAIGAAGGTRLQDRPRRGRGGDSGRGPRPAGRRRPAASPPGRGRRQRRAGGRRGRARGTGRARARRQALARVAPLLRRRQPRRPHGCCGRPSAERRLGVALTQTGRAARSVSSTSRAIWATSSSSLPNTRSSRSRCQSSTTSLRPYRSPAKPSRNASIRSSSPP